MAGVTVEGSHSQQTFRKIDIDLEDDFVPIKVLLRGYRNGPEVEFINEGDTEVAEMSSKKTAGKYCTQCGAKKKLASANFCYICGRKY